MVLAFSRLGIATLAPSNGDSVFADWWRLAHRRMAKQHKKGLNSLIMLGAWLIWKHRNSCVFDHGRPNVQDVVQTISLVQQVWCLAGANKLVALWVTIPRGT